MDPKAARCDCVTVWGAQGSSDAYAIRDFLARSVVTYVWNALRSDNEAAALPGVRALDDARLPLVVMPDGTRLFGATVRQLAEQLGFVNKPKYDEYDLSIYGAGPAGLSAAVYGASEGLRTVLIERHAVGGQAGSSSLIENYMGFPEGVSGATLAERAREQAVRFGAEILQMREGVNATFRDGKIWADLADGSQLVARSNICATGVEWRRLGLPNESTFLGRGVYYGAGASEAPLCVGKTVYVVGGGNSAGQAAMHFAAHADAVVLLVRGASLAATMSSYLVEKLAKAGNIEIRTSTTVVDLHGGDSLEAIVVAEGPDGDARTLPTSRLFICIGGVPHTEWAKDTDIVRDDAGYLVTGRDLFGDRGQTPACWTLEREPHFLETSVPGSFAAGDVRHGSIKRVASAAGEGAMAVAFVHRFLLEDAS
ncbi:MAG: FAD-dependent oxidoreductase [Acidobacteriota bacterium]